MKKLIFLACVCCMAVIAKADPSPKLIPFQGRLTDQNGVAYTNGQFTILFQLYTDAVGGTAIWTERHEKVGVVNGTVNVFLGSISSLDAVTFDQTRHLGITVDADNNPNTPDPEMVPRQMIIPSFWSKYSENSTKLMGHDWSDILVSGTNPATSFIRGDKIQVGGITTAQLTNNSVTSAQIAFGAVNSNQLAAGSINASHLSASFAQDTVIPPGTIQAFGGTNIPAGWLLCDGRVINRTDLPRLFEAIGTSWGNSPNGTNTFNLPDLRGVFLRGVDFGANRDPDKATRTSLGANGNTGNQVGSFQLDAFQGHAHHFLFQAFPAGGGGSPNNQTVYRKDAGLNSPDDRTDMVATPADLNGYGNARFASETRPMNTYVTYIIKY